VALLELAALSPHKTATHSALPLLPSPQLKIKQFSSEGLKRDSTDPLMVAKCKCADWLSDAVAQLETQAGGRQGCGLLLVQPSKGAVPCAERFELLGRSGGT
jgi:hypothetical protein